MFWPSKLNQILDYLQESLLFSVNNCGSDSWVVHLCGNTFWSGCFGYQHHVIIIQLTLQSENQKFKQKWNTDSMPLILQETNSWKLCGTPVAWNCCCLQILRLQNVPRAGHSEPYLLKSRKYPMVSLGKQQVHRGGTVLKCIKFWVANGFIYFIWFLIRKKIKASQDSRNNIRTTFLRFCLTFSFGGGNKQDIFRPNSRTTFRRCKWRPATPERPAGLGFSLMQTGCFSVGFSSLAVHIYIWTHMDVSENRVFSPQIIHFNRVFLYCHHPFWGTSIFGNTHITGPSPKGCQNGCVSGCQFAIP